MPGLLFSDGCNSMTHVVFGMLSVHHPMIIPFFLFYEFSEEGDKNTMVDILEFATGWLFY